jgi:Phage integrase family
MARPRKPTIELPRHVNVVRVKGRPYYYLHVGRGTDRAAKPVRLPDDPRDPAFWAAYRTAMNEPEPQRSANAIDALIEAYKQAPEWGQLSRSTRANWELYLKRIASAWGLLEVRGIEPKHVLALRDKYAATPAAANNLLRCLSSLLSWSVPRGWRADNPCLLVPKLKGGDGYEPWSWDMVQLARQHLRRDLWHAAAVALYSGQRMGDTLAMRWGQVSGNIISVAQEKTHKRLAIPLHEGLRQILAEVPRTAVTILTNTHGAPWTKDGFKTSWQKAFAEPTLRAGAHKPAWPLKPISEAGLVFHGLRKSAVIFLLEAGCSDAEVAAITGQSRTMVEHYGRQVSQRKLAASAILKWERAENRGLQNTLQNPTENKK